MKADNKLFALAALGLTLGCVVSGVAESKPNLFERLQQRFREAPQATVSFEHVVISDFFETADTVAGVVTFAADGRYRTELGDDVFLFDGACLWEYSALYNQATQNCVKVGQSVEDNFLFFQRFGDYYGVEERVPDSVYTLRILEGKRGAAPDSMVVTISPSQERILSLEYYDINKELNLALIREERFAEVALDSLYRADFPDSTEVIVIPG
ncbi:MAG TPA: hypothetical protein VLB27_05380 [candidate division Zixibacteria bacterium]|nr:hypothetical protein [candidate division Zixibacteria bacterium]